MPERTEEDKLLKSPIVVVLAGKEYEIKLLVIKEAREWRKQFSKVLGKLPTYAKTTTDDAEGFSAAINGIMVAMPDEMADLFFAYAKDLNREEIENTATEIELARGIEAIMEVAFPLVRSMTGAMGKMSQ